MRRFAVFDIDGTLIRWQLYHAVVDRLARYDLLDPQLYKAVRQDRMTWKRREYPEAFRAYEARIIQAYEAALPNLPVARFDEIVEEVAGEYKHQVYSYTRQLARTLRGKGHMLLAISGSHQELVEHVGRQYSFDICVGTRYLQKDGRFSGRKIVASHDKKKALQTLIRQHGLTLTDSYAIGDSKSDAPMLEMVEHPIAFNPDQELFDIARRASWEIVIERKNVVYDLVKDRQSYRLQ